MTSHFLAQRVYWQLSTLKDFISDHYESAEIVDLYHSIVDDLEISEEELTRFLVPESVIGISPRASENKSDHQLLKEKIEGILKLFHFPCENGKRKVEFVLS